MKDFLELTSKDIRELGLQPLRNRRDIECIIKSDCIAFVERNHVKSILPVKYCANKKVAENYPYNFFIKKTDYFDMDRDFFKKIGFTNYSIEKYLWLQKYLKGEVSGKFEKGNAEIEIAVHNACERKDKQIENLSKKVADLKSENEMIKEEYKQLKSKIKSIEKIKKLKEIISQIEL